MIEMNLETAERVARAAIARAKAMGVNITVSVVDEAGRLVLCMKGDGTGFLTTETSRAKAVAAANFKRPTIEIVELYSGNPFWSSVPVVDTRRSAAHRRRHAASTSDGRLIGAVGCGGGSARKTTTSRRRARRRSRSRGARRALLLLDPAQVDHALPLADLGGDVALHFGGRRRGGFAAEIDEPLRRVGLRDHLADLGVRADR